MTKCLFAAFLLASSATLAACQSAPEPASDAAEARNAALDMAIAADTRSAANKARDAYRRPYETLSFFGIEPDDMVVEISPGGGWYSEILAPYLAEEGALYVYGSGRSLQRVAGRIESDMPALKLIDSDDAVAVAAMAGKADAVLTFRNVHNWYMADNAGAMFESFAAMLKPDGTLGVVDHRLPEDRDDAEMKSSGYMKTSTVIALAEAAGFELAQQSELNANSKDTADHVGGVWTLPPTLNQKDADRERYLAIGESDRMTLKFRKSG